MRFLLLIPLLALLACRPDAPAADTTDRGECVYAVNYPLQYFAQRIAGEHRDVRFLAPGDVDPAFWNPRDEDIAALQSAELILLNGATYAKWLDLVTLPPGRTVETSASFANELLELPVTVTHSHGEGGAHAHSGTDFNTWLDPALARQHAAAALEALSELDPAHAETFRTNAAALDTDLEALDAAFRELSTGAADLPLIASHPVYGYLASRYGWDVRPLLWEPDRMPTETEWQDLASLLEDRAARWMLYEDTPSPEIAARLREDFGLEPVVLRTCGNRPEDGDYLDEMRAGLARLEPVFQP